MHVCVCLCLSVSVCVCLCLCVCRTRQLSQSVSRHPCVCTHMSAGHGHITSDSASSTLPAAQAHISQTLVPGTIVSLISKSELRCPTDRGLYVCVDAPPLFCGTIVSLISKSELRCPHLAHGVADAITVPCYFPRLRWSMRDARFPAATESPERGWWHPAQRACAVSQQSPATRLTAAPHASESHWAW